MFLGSLLHALPRVSLISALQYSTQALLFSEAPPWCQCLALYHHAGWCSAAHQHPVQPSGVTLAPATAGKGLPCVAEGANAARRRSQVTLLQPPPPPSCVGLHRRRAELVGRGSRSQLHAGMAGVTFAWCLDH